MFLQLILTVKQLLQLFFNVWFVKTPGSKNKDKMDCVIINCIKINVCLML